MKIWMSVVGLSLALILPGCGDPRAPLDSALKNINDIRAFQLQAVALRGLQDDLQATLAREPNVTRADVGLHFASSDGGLGGSRLVVNAIILLTFKPGALWTGETQTATGQPDKLGTVPIQDISDPNAPTTTEPATEPASKPATQNAPAADTRSPDKRVQDLVRAALAKHGWEVEEVDTYNYDDQWRIICQIRAAVAPPAAGIGLDILPKRAK